MRVEGGWVPVLDGGGTAHIAGYGRGDVWGTSRIGSQDRRAYCAGMNHSKCWVGVGILILHLALVASACATSTPPPPNAVLEYEQEVQPALVLIAAVLSEQGFDTAVIDSQSSAGEYSFKITTVGDDDSWTDAHARAAISGAADSLELAGWNCYRYPDNPSVMCQTEDWYIDVQHSADLFNWGLFVSIGGHCWKSPTKWGCPDATTSPSA
jgi:hypothetical protein